MYINKTQIIRIQSAMSANYNRDERLAFISNFLGREILSTKDLTSYEADQVLYFLNTGKTLKANFALFDKTDTRYSSERRLLFSYLYQAGWTVPSQKYGEIPDLDRLSDFIQSAKSPVSIPLKEWEKSEWEKMLHAFRNIVKFNHH